MCSWNTDLLTMIENVPVDVKLCMSTSCENYWSPLLLCSLFSPQCVPVEVDLLTKMPRHTNIIEIYDFGKFDTETVIVMERPKVAQDLFGFLNFNNDRPSVKMEVVKTVFSQILTAVSFCHSSSVFHGDLLMENVLVETHQGTNRAILIDFGEGLELGPDQYCCKLTGKLTVMRIIGLASATPQLEQNAWQRVLTYKSGSKQTYRRTFSAYKTTLISWKQRWIEEKCLSNPASTLLNSYSHVFLAFYFFFLEVQTPSVF